MTHTDSSAYSVHPQKWITLIIIHGYFKYILTNSLDLKTSINFHWCLPQYGENAVEHLIT